MADYTQNTNFAAKDSLTTGDPEKIILGADFDGEFAELESVSSSKEDKSDKGAVSGYCGLDANQLVGTQAEAGSGGNLPFATEAAGGIAELASTAETTALTNDTKIVTPLGVGSVFAAPPALGSGTPAAVAASTLSSSGLATLASLAVTVNATVGGTLGVTGVLSTTAAANLAAASTIASNEIWHAGNDGAGSGLDADTVDAVQLSGLVQTSRTLTAGSAMSGGGSLAANRTFAVELSGLTQIEGNALAASDEFLVRGGGSNKAMRYQDSGLKVNAAISTVKTFADNEMNQVWQLSGATDRAWDMDTGVGVQGNFIVLIQTGAGSIDLSGGTATINTAVGDFSRTQDSVVVGICTATSVWTFYGDMAAS